jgi:hypothetical protein
MTERQIEKTKKKIRSFRSKLSAEKRVHGWYDDSAGNRYDIAVLYVQIQDFKGALRYYQWFSKEFPDDVGFPHFHLFWALTLFENEKVNDAIKKVYKTAFSNTYLVYLICGIHQDSIDKSELQGGASLDYAKQILSTCRASLTLEFMHWLKTICQSTDFNRRLDRFISLQKLIADEGVGQRRLDLLKVSYNYVVEITD